MAINVPIVSSWSDRGIRQATSDIDTFSAKMRRHFDTIAVAGRQLATSLAVAGVATGALVAKAVTAASDLQEAIGQTDVIFGDASDTIKKFASQAATSLGLSKRMALDAAGTFGTFGKAAQLTGQPLAKFSTDMIQLAGDLASFKNTTPEQAIIAIGAALRGESEPIRAYGVLLNETTLKARAMEMGIYDGVGALTMQQKVLAAQAELLAQTSDAQGDFARTSGNFAGQMKILRAQLENAAATIGTKLIPIVMRLVSWIRDSAVPAVRRFWEWIGPILGDAFRALADRIGPVISAIGDKLGPVLEAVIGWMRRNTDVVKVFIAVLAGTAVIAGVIALTAALVSMINPVTLIIAGIAALAAGIYYAWTRFEAFRTIVGAVWEALKLSFLPLILAVKTAFEIVAWAWTNLLAPVFSGIIDVIGVVWPKILAFTDGITNVMGGVGDTIRAIWDGVIGVIKNAWNTIANLWNSTVGAFSFRIPSWVPGLGGKGFDMPDMPTFGGGGGGSSYSSGGAYALATAGALGRSWMGQAAAQAITININSVIDPVTTGNYISKVVTQQRQRAGLIPL